MNSNIHSWINTVLTVLVLILVLVGGNQPSSKVGGSTDDFFNANEGFKVDNTEVISTTGAVTQGGTNCTLTDANGGAYVLTNAELAACGQFTFAAGGAGQAVIALTFPATSTMTTVIPNAGQCRKWYYDASALAAGTTTTMTAGAGHNIIAYTTNDDVIDGNEFSEITMCRASDTDVNTFVTEMLNAD